MTEENPAAMLGVYDVTICGDGAPRAMAPPAGNVKLTAGQYARMFESGQAAGSGGGLGGPSNAYRQSVWVNTCISKIAVNAGRVPIRLSRGPAAGTRAVFGAKNVRQGYAFARRTCRDKAAGRAAEGEIVEFGELYDLLRRPNAEQGFNAFIEATATQLYLHGRVHWLFTEMAGRRPLSIAVVPGARSRPVVDKSGLVTELLGWRIRDPYGAEHSLALDEVVTFQIYDPDDPHAGLSPLQPASLSIISDYNASLYNAAMLNNGCEPGTVLETGASYDPDLDRQMRTSWQQRHGGPRNAARLAILWGGLSHKALGQSLHDMVWPAGKQLSREEVCAVLGVPPSVAGFFGQTGDSSAYTSNEAKRFWQDTMVPLLEKLGDGVNDHVAARFAGGLSAWLDVEAVPIFQEMRRSNYQAANDLWAKGVPLADVNDMLDLGIPERPWHSTGFVPMGIQPADQAAEGFGPLPPMDEAPPDDSEAPGPAADPGSPPAGSGGDGESRINGRDRARGADPLVKAAAARVWRAWQDSWAPLAKRAAATLARHYAAQGRQLARLVRQRLDDGRADAASRRADSSIVNLKSSIDALRTILVEIFNDEREVQRFRARLRPLVADGYELGIRQALAEAGLSDEQIAQAVRALTADPRLVAAIASDTVRITTRVNAQTRHILRHNLIAGLEAGESVNELADRVESVMGGRRRAALATARNSVGQALSAARAEGRAHSGVTHEVWIHSRGPGTRRPAHVAAERTYAAAPKPMGEPFIINGVALRYPRDPQGPAAEIVNCQCLALGKRIRQGARAAAMDFLQPLLARGFVTCAQMADSRQASVEGQSPPAARDG